MHSQIEKMLSEAFDRAMAGDRKGTAMMVLTALGDWQPGTTEESKQRDEIVAQIRAELAEIEAEEAKK